MKSKNALRGITIAVVLQLGVLAGSAQTTNTYLYTGSETNITLNQGTYIITAYGAQGGYGEGGGGGLGAEMEGQFNFAGVTTLTILVGGAGVGATYNSGGGGGGSFVVNGSTPLVIAGAGGGGGIYTGGTGSAGGVGGSNGSGGGGGYAGGGGGGGGYAGGGGGFYTSGTNGNGGYGSGGGSFLNGGAGGSGGTGGNSPNFGYSGSGGYGGGGGGGYFGGGGGGYFGGGGGGGAYFSGGGGGGSIIDSSVITNLAEVSGIASPDDSPNGEIIITVISAVSAPTLTNIVISPTNPVIVVGTNEAFAATGYFSNGSVGSLNSANGLVWSSSNPGVATINTSGVATGLTVGTATITATDGSVSNNTTLTVNMTTPTITNTPPVFQPVTQSGATFTITWSAVPGLTYLVEYKNALSQTSWSILGGPIIATSTLAMVSDVITPAFSERFYRVELLANNGNSQPHVVTITSPTANQQLTNEIFIVSGTVSDSATVVAVFYQLNSQPWTAATTTNGWTNWTAIVMLNSGTNTVRAYSVDAGGKISATNSITFQFFTPQDLPTLLLFQPLPHGQVGQFYDQLVGQGTNGTPPYYFSLQTGSGFPPIGIIMDVNGNLSGTPSVAGTYNFGVCVVDLVGAQDCETATLIIDPAYQLNIVETGTGSGTVTANPPGPTYTNGTIVTLTATPNSGSTFTGWSGAASGSASSVQVTINGNTSVTAEFDNPNVVWNGTWNSTQNFVSSDGTCSQNVTASISLILSVSGGVVSGSGTENGIPCFNDDCSVDSYPTITGPVSGSVSGNTISVVFSGVANGGACDGQSVGTSFTATMINSTTISGTTPSGRAFTYTKQ